MSEKELTTRQNLRFDELWAYDPAPESPDYVKIEEQYNLFIDGKFQEPASGRYFETINPANETLLSRVARAEKSDLDKAVAAARKAYEGVWSKMHAKERGKYIYRIARLLQERAREFAILESMDTGKPIRESREVDIPIVIAHFFYYAGWADKLKYAFPGVDPRPLGVAGQIIPWNFPLLMAAWKIAPALATGNTVVIKPASSTPLTLLRLGELIRDAGVPAGVVNIVTGPGEIGSAIANHPDIDKIAFTGSTEIGRTIQEASLRTGKKYTLELGGKAANIVFDDAPVEEAVEGIVNGIFFNQGHVCCAGSRLLVQEGVADELVHKLKMRMETLIVGDPLDKNTDIGAINSKGQLDSILGYLTDGVESGLQIYQTKCQLPEKGFWCPPTLVENVSQAHRIVQEEVFGPVLTIQTFRTPEEAVSLANNTPYGLSGGIWTDKGSKIFKVGKGIRAGVIWANTFNKFDPTSPFGGYKESGMGREGGIHGLLPYLEISQ